MRKLLGQNRLLKHLVQSNIDTIPELIVSVFSTWNIQINFAWRLLLREDEAGLEHDTSRQSNEAELRSIRSKSPHPQDGDWAAAEYNAGLNDFHSDFSMTTRRTIRRKSSEYPRIS